MADFFTLISDAVINVLNAVFNPLLAMDPNPTNPALTVLVIAFIVSLITTIANKLLVDQDEVNRVQAEMKEFQKKLRDRKSTRLNSSHPVISYAVFCLKKKT